MNLESISARLGRIEEKMDAIARLSACLESIAEKIEYMDKTSKERVAHLEAEVEESRRAIDEIRWECGRQTARCPADKISRFEILIFGACVTTMGSFVAALVVAYFQLKSGLHAAGGG